MCYTPRLFTLWLLNKLNLIGQFCNNSIARAIVRYKLIVTLVTHRSHGRHLYVQLNDSAVLDREAMLMNRSHEMMIRDLEEREDASFVEIEASYD